MKKSGIGIIIGIVSGLVALSAALTAFILIRDKKKRDEEELDRYLEDAIQ